MMNDSHEFDENANNKGKIRSIYVVGAQCTGKTTLVKQLAAWFQQQGISPPVISEVARTVMARQRFATSDISSVPNKSLHLQHLILEAQYEAEKDALQTDTWFISDRSGLDPIAYAQRFVGLAAARQMLEQPNWVELKRRMAQSVVIVCEAGMDWLVDDGVRLMPKGREDWLRFHEEFCLLLTETNLPYYVLPSSIQDSTRRVQRVVDIWSAIIE